MKLSLPFSQEIATTDVSQGANEGTWRLGRGSGWAIKKASCMKNGDLMVGGAERCYMYRGSTDPASLS